MVIGIGRYGKVLIGRPLSYITKQPNTGYSLSLIGQMQELPFLPDIYFTTLYEVSQSFPLNYLGYLYFNNFECNFINN